MNIAFLTGISIRSDAPGGSVHVAQVAAHLARRGHRLVTNLPDEPEVFRGRLDPGPGGESVKPDAFYIRIDGWPERDTLTLYRRRNLRAPCIWEVNAPVEERRTYGDREEQIGRWNERRKVLARLADAAICVSEEMEDYARTFLGIGRTYVVPNGSEPEMFSPDRKDPSLFGDGRFTAIWVGSGEYRWQGVDVVRRVAERLRDIDRDILLLATVEGPSTENLHCLGRIPYPEMPRWIASADVGLCIYEDIDFYPRFYFSPLKLFDYMACGLPVIGSDMGQIRRVLTESGGGILTPNTVDGIVGTLRRLKQDGDLRREMGRKGRKAVVEKYSWGTVALRTEKIFHEVARHVRGGVFLRETRYFLAKGIAAGSGRVDRVLRRLRRSVARRHSAAPGEDGRGGAEPRDVSVVVCTRDRAESLGQTLRTLGEVAVPEGCAWEIIVVDNHSTDGTRGIVEAFRAASGFCVTYTYEPKPGLSHARNRGLTVAKGAVVAFTDDDIIVDRSWLREIVREAGSKDAPAMIYGQTRRYTEETAWLSIKEDETRRRFAFPCSPWSVGHGNNMILKRNLQAAIGMFDPDLGAGTRVGAAEDSDYVYRVLRSGGEVLYAPSIIVYHNHGRISEDACRRINRNYQMGKGAFYCKHVLQGDTWAARLLYWELRVLVGMLFEGEKKREKALFTMQGLAMGLGMRTVQALLRTPGRLLEKANPSRGYGRSDAGS